MSEGVFEAVGAMHHLQIVWCPPVPAVAAPFGLRVDPRLLDQVAAVVRRALAETSGDVLVFLPGAGEVASVAGRLRDLHRDVDRDVEVLPLHGRLPAAAQDSALRKGPRRRVVLATAVAESSLTVPGVRVVVDAGLARVPRTDLGRGLGALVTVPVSRASAHQRAGRAGRDGPGRVYRCWSAAEHERLPAHPEPEVATADLTGFVLELACWGAPGGRGLALLDPLPAGAIEVAGQVLRGLGAVDARGEVTARGRALTAVGTHERLARALLDGAPLVGTRTAAEVVAVLSDETLAGPGDDLAAVLRALRAGRDRSATSRWNTEVRRLSQSVPAHDGQPMPPDLAAGLVVGLAFPERLARQRRPDSPVYLMAGGTGAELPPGAALAGAGWLAVAVADRSPGRPDARVRLAVAIDEATARETGATLLRDEDEVVWADGDVRARRVERLGAVVLTERPLTHPDPAAVTVALQDGIRREGLELLRWTPAARQLRQRLAACHHGLGEPWPDVSDAALLDGLNLSTARNRADLRRIDLARALRALVPWSLAGQLDEAAPSGLRSPADRRCASTTPTRPRRPCQ